MDSESQTIRSRDMTAHSCELLTALEEHARVTTELQRTLELSNFAASPPIPVILVVSEPRPRLTAEHVLAFLVGCGFGWVAFWAGG